MAQANTSRLEKFLEDALGTQALSALRAAVSRDPRLAKAMPQRAIVSWALTAIKHSYDGPIPGQDDQWLRIQKTESGYRGAIHDGKEMLRLDGELLEIVAGLAVALEMEPDSAAEKLSANVANRLGKNLDQIIGTRLVRQELELQEKLCKALSLISPGKPVGVGTHDYTHVLDDKNIQRGYSLHVHHDPDSGLLKATVKHRGNTVGTVKAEHQGNSVSIDDAEIHPDHRQRGLGVNLYEAVMAHGYHQGAKTVQGGVHSSMAGRVHAALARKHGLDYRQAPTPFPHLASPEQGEYDGHHGPYSYTIKGEPNANPTSSSGRPLDASQNVPSNSNGTQMGEKAPPKQPVFKKAEPSELSGHHVLWDQLQQEGWHPKHHYYGFNEKPHTMQLLNPKYFDATGHWYGPKMAEEAPHGEILWASTHGPGAQDWKGSPQRYHYHVAQSKDPSQLSYKEVPHTMVDPEARLAVGDFAAPPKSERDPSVVSSTTSTHGPLNKGWPKDEQENQDNATAHMIVQDSLEERGAKAIPGNTVAISRGTDKHGKPVKEPNLAAARRTWAAQSANKSHPQQLLRAPHAGGPDVDTPPGDWDSGGWDYNPDDPPPGFAFRRQDARRADRGYWQEVDLDSHSRAFPIPHLEDENGSRFEFSHRYDNSTSTGGDPDEKSRLVHVEAVDRLNPDRRSGYGEWNPQTQDWHFQTTGLREDEQLRNRLHHHLVEYFTKNPLAKKEADVASLQKNRPGPTYPKLGFPDDRRETDIVNGPRQTEIKMRAQAQSIRHAGHDLSADERMQAGQSVHSSLGSAAIGPFPGAHAYGQARRTQAYNSLNPDLQDENTALLDPKALPAVQLHENVHGLLNRVAQKHGQDARNNLAMHMWAWTTYRAPAAAHAVSESLKRYYGFRPGQVPFEEFLATTLNIANSPADRKDMQTRLGLDDQQMRQLHGAFNTAHQHMLEGGKHADHRWLQRESFKDFLREHQRSAPAGMGVRPDQLQLLPFMVGATPREKAQQAAAAAPPKKHFLDDQNTISKSELKKMAVGTIAPGKQVGTVNEPSDTPDGHDLRGGQIFDYNHHLKHPDYQLQVIDTAAPHGQKVLLGVLHHGGQVVGQVEGSILGTDMEMRYSSIEPEHRGQGLGQKMYEALYAHGFHHHGVKTVSGQEHSTSAAGVHNALKETHGFAYKAKDVPEGQRQGERDLGDDFDNAKKPYRYTIKSELSKAMPPSTVEGNQQAQAAQSVANDQLMETFPTQPVQVTEPRHQYSNSEEFPDLQGKMVDRRGKYPKDSAARINRIIDAGMANGTVPERRYDDQGKLGWRVRGRENFDAIDAQILNQHARPPELQAAENPRAQAHDSQGRPLVSLMRFQWHSPSGAAESIGEDFHANRLVLPSTPLPDGGKPRYITAWQQGLGQTLFGRGPQYAFAVSPEGKVTPHWHSAGPLEQHSNDAGLADVQRHLQQHVDTLSQNGKSFLKSEDLSKTWPKPIDPKDAGGTAPSIDPDGEAHHMALNDAVQEAGGVEVEPQAATQAARNAAQAVHAEHWNDSRRLHRANAAYHANRDQDGAAVGDEPSADLGPEEPNARRYAASPFTPKPGPMGVNQDQHEADLEADKSFWQRLGRAAGIQKSKLEKALPKNHAENDENAAANMVVQDHLMENGQVLAEPNQTVPYKNPVKTTGPGSVKTVSRLQEVENQSNRARTWSEPAQPAATMPKLAEKHGRSYRRVSTIDEPSDFLNPETRGKARMNDRAYWESVEAGSNHGTQPLFRPGDRVTHKDSESVPWVGIVQRHTPEPYDTEDGQTLPHHPNGPSWRDHDVDGPGHYFNVKWNAEHPDRREHHDDWLHQDNLVPVGGWPDPIKKGWPKNEKQNQENRAGFFRESPPSEDFVMEQGLPNKTVHTASQPSWMDYGAASPEEKAAWPTNEKGKLTLPPANPAAQLSDVDIIQDPRAAAPINGGTEQGRRIWEAEDANNLMDGGTPFQQGPLDVGSDHRFEPPTRTPSTGFGESRFWEKLKDHTDQLAGKRSIRNRRASVVDGDQSGPGTTIKVQKLPKQIANKMQKGWPRNESENQANGAAHSVMQDSMLERGAQPIEHTASSGGNPAAKVNDKPLTNPDVFRPPDDEPLNELGYRTRVWDAELSNQRQGDQALYSKIGDLGQLDVSDSHRFEPPSSDLRHGPREENVFWRKVRGLSAYHAKQRSVRNGKATVNVQKLPKRVATEMARAVHENEHHPSVPFDPKAPRDANGRVKKSELLQKTVIHDDPDKPMTVYRVENEDTAGPYAEYPGRLESLDDEPEAPGQPPHPQRPSPNLDFHPSEHNDIFDADVFYAFEHPDHATNWFGAKDMKALQRAGFKLRPVLASKVWRSQSGKQVAFIPYDGRVKKVEMPGQTHQPKKQLEPIAPDDPDFQPSITGMAKKPRKPGDQT